MNLSQILSDITEELRRSEKIHPKYPDDLVYRCAIVSEEEGELIKAINDYREGKGPKDDIKKEAIHLGATVLRFLKNFK